MTTTDQPGGEPKSMLEVIDDRLAAVDKKLEDEKKDRGTQIRWLRRAVAVLVAIGLLFGLYYKHSVDEDQKNRAEKRAGLCSGFDAYTNALLSLGGPPQTEEARARRQAQADAFKVDFEQRTSALGCVLHLPPVPNAPEASP